MNKVAFGIVIITFTISIAHSQTRNYAATRPLAEQGDAVAQHRLGFLYEFGQGVPENYAEAIKWYLLSAEKGNESAQYDLARMYEQGKGISVNYLAAYIWYSRSAAQGFPPANSHRDDVASKLSVELLALGQEIAINNDTPIPSSPMPDNNVDDKEIAASSGTGFFVTLSGHVITNHHVINGCSRLQVHTQGKQYEAEVLAIDNSNDLAILKTDIKPLYSFSISKDAPYALQDIYAVGYPFGQELSSSIKVTGGIISSLAGLGNNYSNIQIDAALQPGNSGGPIIDEFGNVVAVAVAKLDYAETIKRFDVIPENINFGIKASVVANLLDGNNISTLPTNNIHIPKSVLSQKVAEGTVYISCWMTSAQIRQFESSKILFKNLQ